MKERKKVWREGNALGWWVAGVLWVWGTAGRQRREENGARGGEIQLEHLQIQQHYFDGPGGGAVK